MSANFNTKGALTGTEGNVYRLNHDLRADNGTFKAGTVLMINDVKYYDNCTVVYVQDYEYGCNDTVTLAAASVYKFKSYIVEDKDTKRVNNRLHSMRKSEYKVSRAFSFLDVIWTSIMVVSAIAELMCIIYHDCFREVCNTIGVLGIITMLVMTVVGLLYDNVRDIMLCNIFSAKNMAELEIGYKAPAKEKAKTVKTKVA